MMPHDLCALAEGTERESRVQPYCELCGMKVQNKGTCPHLGLVRPNGSTEVFFSKYENVKMCEIWLPAP